MIDYTKDSLTTSNKWIEETLSIDIDGCGPPIVVVLVMKL